MPSEKENTIKMKEEVKGGLFLAIEEALKKETETERIVAVLDCIRGYKNEFDTKTEKNQYDGFLKCKIEFKNQIRKVQDYIAKR
ncbi:MAG TPA: hypothetical protein VN026_17150 [Bacteroidia bacterium]|nr:hypothetical protein [Bacteroidia bacterium]